MDALLADRGQGRRRNNQGRGPFGHGRLMLHAGAFVSRTSGYHDLPLHMSSLKSVTS